MTTEFGKFLKVVRIKKGETAKQMAEKLGFSASYLSSIESGARNIPTSIEAKITQNYALTSSEKRTLRKSIMASKKTQRLSLDGISDEAKNIIMLLSKCNLDKTLIEEMEMLFMSKMDDKEIYADLYSMGKLIEFLPVGVGIYKLEDSNVFPLFVSEKACEFLGFTFKDYKKRIESKMPVYSTEIAEFILDSAKKDSTETQEKTFSTLDINGKRVWLRFIVNFVAVNGKQVCYATIVDATETVGRAKVYNEQREIYELLLNEVDMLVFQYYVTEDRMKYSIKMPGRERITTSVDEYRKDIEKIKYVHKDYIDTVASAIDECISSQPDTKEILYKGDYDGAGFCWYRAIIKSIKDKNGEVYMLIGKSENCDDEIKKNMRLKVKAELDFNTNLFNRSTTEEKINSLLKTASKKTPMAFVEFDVDDFKLFNDKYGHLVGDEILHHLGAVTLKAISKDEIAGRAGGDEFVLLLRHNVDKESISKRCEKLVSDLESRISDIGIEEKMTISFGCVIIDAPTDFISVMASVDKFMYNAKRMGKNKVIFGEDTK